MIILGLDLSTRTGFALGATDSRRPYSWTENLRVTDDLPAQATRRLACSLRNQIEACQRDGRPIDLVAYERPLTGSVISRMGRSQSFIGDMLQGFAALAEGIPACYGIRSESVAVQTVRKAFVGNPRPDNAKRRVMSQCRRLGWGSPGFDDNEADAMAVWYWACLTHAPKEAPVVGPLFVAKEEAI